MERKWYSKKRTCKDKNKIRRVSFKTYEKRLKRCEDMGFDGYTGPRCYKGKKQRGTCWYFSKGLKAMRVKPSQLNKKSEKILNALLSKS